MKNSLTKKLLLAVITLGIAVIATVGSTYAWFSMNTTVEATGMQLTATTPVNVVISDQSNGTYTNAIEFSTETRNLYPVSTVNANITSAGTYEFFAVKEGQVIGENGVGGPSSSATEFQSSAIASETVDAHNYLIEEKIYLKTTGGKVALKLEAILLDNTDLLDASSHAIESSANAGVNKLADAIYVALCTKNGVFIYQAGDGDGVNGVQSVSNEGVRTLGTYSFSAVNDTPIFDTAANGGSAGQELTTTPEEVTVLVWLEGEDPDCVNAIGGLGLSIGLKFAYITDSYEAE